MEKLSFVFKALADSNRIRILKVLEERPLCVCEITDVLKLAPSTVSKHLSILKSGGFLLDDKQGRWVEYRLNSKPDEPSITQLLQLLKNWFNDNEQVLKDKQMIKNLDRQQLCSSFYR